MQNYVNGVIVFLRSCAGPLRIVVGQIVRVALLLLYACCSLEESGRCAVLRHRSTRYAPRCTLLQLQDERLPVEPRRLQLAR